MRRPNYSVVTGCTVAVAAFCFLRLAFQRFIPPAHPEIAEWARGDYVLRGQDTGVAWRPPTAETFAEAQRLSRPLLVVVGLPWSAAARQADEAFRNPDIAWAVNRGFVPVRIDGATDPRWLSQFLPLERAHGAFGVGFQVWVFDLKHRLIDTVARARANDDLRGSGMLGALLGAQERFGEAALSDDVPERERSQQANVERLLQTATEAPSLHEVAPTLLKRLDPHWGTWTVNDLALARPLAYRLLQRSGREAEAGAALRRLLATPCADPLDGGLYRLARTDIAAPEYDKPAVANAWFAETLAEQDALRPDPALRKAARRTVDWLLSLRSDGLVPGAEQGDEDPRGRSARASFPPSRLRDLVSAGKLSPEDRRWAEDALRLGGAARVVAPSPRALDDPRLETVLSALREAAGPRRSVVASGLCDVNATVAARLLRCARLWNDRALADAGGELIDRLEAFQSASGLRHVMTDGPTESGYLGDALAYADAQFADYLTNGRVPSLERGASVLRRALQAYAGPQAGIWRASPDNTPLMTGVGELPQVTDDEREATSAAALRLLDAYATILGPPGEDLRAAANDVAANLGAAVDAVPAMGGALGALAAHGDPRAVIVAGPDAVERASRLARRLPSRLVFPVLGPARPDLKGRPRGVYLTVDGSVTGPMTDDEAVQQLGGALASLAP